MGSSSGRRVNGAMRDYGAAWSAPADLADSFTDCGIDAAVEQTTRLGRGVKSRTALNPFPCQSLRVGSALGGFPWARYYDLAHGNPISDIRYRAEQKGEFEGAKPPHARAAACCGKGESAARFGRAASDREREPCGERGAGASGGGGAGGTPAAVFPKERYNCDYT